MEKFVLGIGERHPAIAKLNHIAQEPEVGLQPDILNKDTLARSRTTGNQQIRKSGHHHIARLLHRFTLFRKHSQRVDAVSAGRRTASNLTPCVVGSPTSAWPDPSARIRPCPFSRTSSSSLPFRPTT